MRSYNPRVYPPSRKKGYFPTFPRDTEIREINTDRVGVLSRSSRLIPGTTCQVKWRGSLDTTPVKCDDITILE